ncbi:hypothetical protein [Taibaiella chishuiensis]|uniref:Uncharacterized protein n=1 Tax=Taibaiella chishuiensis TaxID=1434707 RepID=A0A2P8DB59_9BACT|nr:hypothetical protein [Taibaiella chishuiensis]PSK94458.1 hypothetical protein B0I18_101614 [Taibaiella chishuiensis]
MKKLIVKFLVFVLPVLVVLLIPTIILRATGENFKPIDQLSLSGAKYIIGYSNNENNYSYLKWHVAADGPKNTVMALGSSRVMEFRAKMFDVPFYNLGWAATSLTHFQPFLESLPEEKYPQYLIIGLDQWYFNKNTDSLRDIPSKEKWKNSFTYFSQASIYRGIYSNLLHRKLKLSMLKQRDGVQRIGLNAVMNNVGFLNDGSMYYGDELTKLLNGDPASFDYKFHLTYDRINSGNRKFEYGSTLNPEAFVILERLLSYCKAHNIKVIAFLAPFSDEIYHYMEQSGNYSYIPKIYPAIKPVFERYNSELYDFTTVSSVNSNDQEVVDGLHGGELTYLKLVIKMLEKGSELNKVTNLDRLRQDATKPINRYTVYGI